MSGGKTPLQHALDLTSNKIVQACAGAGKTYALAKRYCAIVDDFLAENRDNPSGVRPGIPNILVITFTKKAAAEMAGRIYADLNILLSGREIPDMQKQGISLGSNIRNASEREKLWLRSTFAQNAISTIDSFCGGILREYADEAGLDPQYQLPEDHEYARDFDKLLSAFLTEQSNNLRDELRILFTHTGLANARYYFSYLDVNKPFLEPWIDYIAQTAYEEILHKWEASGLVDKESDKDRQAVTVLKSLVTLFREFDAIISHHKRQSNYLTFNDIIMKTRKVLQDIPGAREKYFLRYPHILVDEFQDTNDIRWDILKMIATDSRGNLRTKGLFIIGDRKQSIFRFLKADVSVVNRAEELLTRSVPDRSHVVVSYNENYRSSRNYIDTVINPLFSFIFPGNSGERKPFEAVFEPTVCAAQNTSDKEIADNTPVCCSIQAAGYTKDHDKNYVAALNTAVMVRELLEWGKKNGLDRQGKPVVAVLLKKFSNIKHFLQVFSLYDIPFEIIEGRDLYSQQEVFDLYHLVCVLLNPYDDIAMTGLLRSPVFSRSDDEIDSIGGEDRTRDISFYTAMMGDTRFQDVIRLIDSWRARAQTHPLDRLLEEILSEDNREAGYYSELNGSQRIANIDRIIHVIHKLSLDGATLHDVHDYLKFSINQNPKVPQADKPSENLVQIMTIHKAKGLQFPAVVIPEMSSMGQRDKTLLLHGQAGESRPEVGVKLIDDYDEPYNSTINDMLAKASKEEAEAEEKRLFYVAVTRAVYRVAFLAELNASSKTFRSYGWWNHYMEKLYELPRSHDEEAWRDSAERFPATEAAYYTPEALTERLGSPEKRSVRWSKPPVYPKPKLYREVTVHDLMAQVYPVPAASNPGAPGYELDGASGFFLSVGRLFHKIMENEWWDIEKHRRDIELIIENDYEIVNEEMRKKLLRELERHVGNFRSSDLYGDLHRLPGQDKFTELPVTGWANNGELYLKVAGVIDLLYKKDGAWYILDYKTSYNKANIKAFELQIRTYQWIVRQLYNIEAAGQIYFSNTNELVCVDKDESYFSALYAHYEKPFSPTEVTTDNGRDAVVDLVRKISAPDIVIINSTRQQVEKVTKSLVKERIFTPGIRVTTLNDLLRSHHVPGRRLNSYQCGLVIRKLLGEDSGSSGKVDELTEAVLLDEEWHTGMIERYSGLLREFQRMKQKKRWFTDTDVKNHFAESSALSNAAVIVNGMYHTSPVHFSLIRKIAGSCREFYFIDNFNEGSTINSFSYDHTAWESLSALPEEAERPICEICYSVEVEVDRAARHILSTDGWMEKLDTIKIAVSNMERYVPVIKRIFGWYGIPTRVAKREPVSERPVAQLLLSVIRLAEGSAEPSLQDIFSVLLHPLMEPDNDMYLLDRMCRQQGLHSLDALASYFEKTGDDNTKVTEKVGTAFQRLKLFAAEKLSADNSDNMISAAELLRNFIVDNQLEQKVEADAVSSGALREIIRIIDQIPALYDSFGLRGGYEDFRSEFESQIAKSDVASVEQEYGFEILGFLDTVQIDPEKLYILGMTEGEMPVKPRVNHFMKSQTHNPWHWNAHLLKHWMRLGSRVWYFSPERDTGGEVLQPSTFLESFKVIRREQHPVLKPKRITTRRHFRQFAGAYITGNDHDRFVHRHNAYLLNGSSPFHGQTGSKSGSVINLSPSQMDNLLKCPMRYWFAHRLSLEEIDLDAESERIMKRGSVVHKALEIFGENNGFAELIRDEKTACGMLADSLDEVLGQYGIDADSSLFDNALYGKYRGGLREGRPDNILAAMLRWNKTIMQNYGFRPHAFEYSFGLKEGEQEPVVIMSDGNLEMRMRGRIDKIFLSENGDAVLATDYKTGGYNLDDIREHWSSQFMMYYMALRSFFPDKRVLLAYEQLKSMKEKQHGFSPLVGDIDLENDPVSLKLQGKGRTIKDIRVAGEEQYEESGEKIVYIQEVKARYLDLAQKIASGDFHIADRELDGKACDYCVFERLCRKSCVMRT